MPKADEEGETVKLGFIGLGRMGRGMVLRLLAAGHQVVGYARTRQTVDEIKLAGAGGAYSLAELCESLPRPRLVWLMVPAGDTIDKLLWGEPGLLSQLDCGDIIVDGGNSHYRDSMRRAAKLEQQGINFLDAGTSGGLEGAASGVCLMLGGDPDVFRQVEPVFKSIACKDGYRLVGASGAGHFAKMVHNGIEYGLLQVLGEGFWLLEDSEFNFDLAAVADLWSHGSVIRSWLIELAARALANRDQFDQVGAAVGGGATGQWAIEEARARGVPMPLINLAHVERLASRQRESFSHRLVAALRWEFGGHEVERRQP
jgi:6-phosphogluconate dehydrogenase